MQNTKNHFLTYHNIITAINKYRNIFFDDRWKKITILPGISYNVETLISSKKGCKISISKKMMQV